MIRILTGDPFLTSRASKKIIRGLFGVRSGSENLEVLDGAELKTQRILESIRERPLFSGTRLIVVHQANKLKKGDMELLEPHLPDLAKEGEILFVAESVDRRLRFWQKAAAVAQWQELKPPFPRDLPRWIAEEGKALGVRIAPEAASWLASRLGSEPGLLVSAIEKALLFVGTGGEVKVSDLEGVVDSFAWKDLFELTRAIGTRQCERAFRLLRQMLLSGEASVGILALVARHFRLLWRVKETGEGVPPYFLKDYQAQAQGFSEKSLSEILERLFQTDWRLKSEKISDTILLEGLVWELIGKGTGRTVRANG